MKRRKYGLLIAVGMIFIVAGMVIMGWMLYASRTANRFEAQVEMFPSMMQPGVQEYIDLYKEKALAWKMSGAGGGGYLALVCRNQASMPAEAVRIKIRRSGM